MATSRKHPFTLVELLAVIAIILLLAGLTIGGLNYAARRSDLAKTLAIMTEFETALDAFKADYGYYPVQKTADDVDFSKNIWDTFTNRTANKRNRPYLEGIAPSEKLLDAYGNALQYEYPNSESSRNTTKFALWSKGPKEDDASDDICNWNQN